MQLTSRSRILQLAVVVGVTIGIVVVFFAITKTDRRVVSIREHVRCSDNNKRTHLFGVGCPEFKKRLLQDDHPSALFLNDDDVWSSHEDVNEKRERSNRHGSPLRDDDDHPGPFDNESKDLDNWKNKGNEENQSEDSEENNSDDQEEDEKEASKENNSDDQEGDEKVASEDKNTQNEQNLNGPENGADNIQSSVASSLAGINIGNTIMIINVGRSATNGTYPGENEPVASASDCLGVSGADRSAISSAAVRAFCDSANCKFANANETSVVNSRPTLSSLKPSLDDLRRRIGNDVSQGIANDGGVNGMGNLKWLLLLIIVITTMFGK